MHVYNTQQHKAGTCISTRLGKLHSLNPDTVHNIKHIQSGGHNQNIAQFQYAWLICNVDAAALKISNLAYVGEIVVIMLMM